MTPLHAGIWHLDNRSASMVASTSAGAVNSSFKQGFLTADSTGDSLRLVDVARIW